MYSMVMSTMDARASAEARRAELVRAFLMDLEHEHSRSHRLAFQAQWGLDARPRATADLGPELDLPERAELRMLDEALMYARKWFGVEVVDDAIGAHAMRQAA